MVFLFSKDAIPLLDAIAENPGVRISLEESLGMLNVFHVIPCKYFCTYLKFQLIVRQIINWQRNESSFVFDSASHGAEKLWKKDNTLS